MRKLSSLVIPLLLCTLLSLSLSGCSMLRAIIPGGVTPADAEWTGIVTGEPISIIATAGQATNTDPATLSALTLALTLTGHTDLLGTLLPVRVKGEESPRWVICSGEEWVKRCGELKPMTQIKFAGSLKSPLIWKPASIRVDD